MKNNKEFSYQICSAILFMAGIFVSFYFLSVLIYVFS
jgi:hypothetical protein